VLDERPSRLQRAQRTRQAFDHEALAELHEAGVIVDLSKPDDSDEVLESTKKGKKK
jgi:hypothetical protein